jgi:hypothetical protein
MWPCLTYAIHHAVLMSAAWLAPDWCWKVLDLWDEIQRRKRR